MARNGAEDGAGPPGTELPPARTWWQARPVRMDVLLGGLLLVLTAVTLASPGVDLSGPQAALAVTGVVVQALALPGRRQAPVLVLSVCTVVMVLTVVLVGDPVATEFGVLFAVFAVAVRRPPRLTWGAVVLLLLTATLTSLLALEMQAPQAVPSRTEAVLTQVLGLLLTVLVAMALGLTVRGRREQVAVLEERARQLALERDQREQLAAADERARMAREMHDVVAHSVAVMVTLAHGAAASMDRNPEGARRALSELAGTGRTALEDTRRILGVLRDGPGGDPLPGAGPGWQEHGDVTALVERFRQAGLPVRLVERGPDLPDDLPLQHAVYRIVQEGLTNVLSHAPGSSDVQVLLDRCADHVVAEVSNSTDRPGAGPQKAAPGSGRGLAGMRERAAAHRGSLEAGPTDDGWRVRATLRYRHTG